MDLDGYDDRREGEQDRHTGDDARARGDYARGDHARGVSALAGALSGVLVELVRVVREDEGVRGAVRAAARELLRLTEPASVGEADTKGPVPSMQEDAVAEAPPPVEEPKPKENLEEIVPPLTLGLRGPEVVYAPSMERRTTPREVTHADLQWIEQRCRLKAEGARWAAQRRRLMNDRVDFRSEIEPLDKQIIERAKGLPECFLWMCHPTGPSPFELGLWDDVAGCFDAVAAAVGIVRNLEAEGEGRGAAESEVFERAVELLAEAQSALRAAVEDVGWSADSDQNMVFFWLKQTCSSRQIYIPRFMRITDPADPQNWPELMERIEALEAELQEMQTQQKRQKSAMSRIQYHLNRISQGSENEGHDWTKVIESVEQLMSGGVAPSNRELRDLLLPVLDRMPDREDLSAGFRRVLREIDNYLVDRPQTEQEEDAEPSAAVREAARLLAGRVVVLIGGERRPYAQEALQAAFGLKELRWLSTREHESVTSFEAQVARPEVAIVMLAIRWTSHSFGEIRQFCERHGKPLVRLPGGYNPNQVAAQMLNQAAERLRHGVATA